MPVLDNIRLRELVGHARRNRPFHDDLVGFLTARGYAHFYDFVREDDGARACAALDAYFDRPLPNGIVLFDGLGRPYPEARAKWLYLAWIFREAPEQRLKPLLAYLDGTPAERRRRAIDHARREAARLFDDPVYWEWPVLAEILLDRLEGSRRSSRGRLVEDAIRHELRTLFAGWHLRLEVSDLPVRIGSDTIDIEVRGAQGRILMPVKSRETMGGGHAGLYTRDIDKAIRLARETGATCIPVVIAEAWRADLGMLGCEHVVRIKENPSSRGFDRALAEALAELESVFRSLGDLPPGETRGEQLGLF